VTAEAIPDGAWPVMLTPFHEDRSIDWDGVDALTDWYVGAGVAGLFAVAQTSEMYALSAEERLALAERVVKRVGGSVPVVASGTFGGAIADQVESVKAVAATGVTAVVAITSQIAGPGVSDRILVERLLELRDGVGGIPLGLYECPQPYKRLLSADVLGQITTEPGFVFLKDTTEQPEAIAEKVAACEGSALKLFNAETSSLLRSVRAGAHGFCGNAGSYYPELMQWLCEAGARGDDEAERVQQVMTVVDAVVSSPLYPASAKSFVSRVRGLDISPVCRVTTARPGEHDVRQLVQLGELVRRLGLPVALG